jgi:hypothetical protein
MRALLRTGRPARRRALFGGAIGSSSKAFDDSSCAFGSSSLPKTSSSSQKPTTHGPSRAPGGPVIRRAGLHDRRARRSPGPTPRAVARARTPASRHSRCWTSGDMGTARARPRPCATATERGGRHRARARARRKLARDRGVFSFGLDRPGTPRAWGRLTRRPRRRRASRQPRAPGRKRRAGLRGAVWPGRARATHASDLL